MGFSEPCHRVGALKDVVSGVEMPRGSSQNGSKGVPAETEAMIDRFLDAIWMERGLSANTLSAYRADLMALTRWLNERNRQLAPATRQDLLDYLAWRVGSGARPEQRRSAAGGGRRDCADRRA